MAQNQRWNKIRSYITEFKVEVVERLRRTGSQNILVTAKEYNAGQKRVRKWDDKYDQLLDCNTVKCKKKRKLYSGVELCSQQLGSDVHLFLEEERTETRVVRNRHQRESLRDSRDALSNNSWPLADGSLHERNTGMSATEEVPTLRRRFWENLRSTDLLS